MISCTEFIAAYSELFKYIEKKEGEEGVYAYWKYISRNGLPLLEKNVRKSGLRGCYDYWTHTLNEEAADFTMTLDEENNRFLIEMHHCPSKGRLLEFSFMEPYHNYCKHCDVLYRRVLEPLGYSCETDLSNVDKATCTLEVRKIK